jgi:3-methylcrotonyl-CoA carboxylase alpha subunit
VDAGVRQGDDITPHYDSMIAKLIVWGETREQALALLDASLRDTHIVGLHTNVAFLRRCAATASFTNADLDTALIEREKDALFGQPGLPLDEAAAAVVAHTLAEEGISESADPWSRRDGWRLFGAAQRRFELEVDGERHQVLLARHHQGSLALTVQGRVLPLALRSTGTERHELHLEGRRVVVTTYKVGEQVAVFGAHGSALVTEVDVIAHAGQGQSEAGRLTAPMPGKLVAFLAQPGDAITKGQPLAVMEAMKMEHTITAPRDGVVAELLFAIGDQVGDGAELLRLQA